MSATPKHLLIFNRFGNSFQDYLLHYFPRYQDKVDRPVVLRIFLLALLKIGVILIFFLSQILHSDAPRESLQGHTSTRNLVLSKKHHIPSTIYTYLLPSPSPRAGISPKLTCLPSTTHQNEVCGNKPSDKGIQGGKRKAISTFLRLPLKSWTFPRSFKNTAITLVVTVTKVTQNI